MVVTGVELLSRAGELRVDDRTENSMSRETAGSVRQAFPQSTGRDEAALLSRIADRDARGFEDLYRSYNGRLSRFILNMVRRPHLVEEILNDTMMVVWRKAGDYDGHSKVSTWIFAIAYRRALNALRGLKEPVEDKDAERRESPEDGPERQFGRRQVHDLLLTAMNQLSADHRAVVDLTYFHERDYREIAEIMACPVDTVKTRMYHARRHLKRVLAGQLSDWL
jgi:RNA polymerase sigma-70 factor (ECF subfamily)